LFSTAYFPPLEYMAALIRAQVVEIEQYETYPKQTYRNRCVICTANGVQNLSIPVIKPFGNQTKTKDILIQQPSSNWQIIHWRAIQSAYRKAPYFEHYVDELEIFFNQQHELLIHLNQNILQTLLSILKIDVTFGLTTCYEKKPKEKVDLRSHFSPKYNADTSIYTEYYQVFKERTGFIPNLSILDLLFCEGPGAMNYLQKLGDAIQDRLSAHDRYSSASF
jgi:hypothetical protein